MDLKNLTIKKAHEHLVKGDFSALELANAYKAEAVKRNPEINAYLEIFSDIDEQAKAADDRIKAGKADMLTGIPFAIKDIILIKGRIASGASKILENYRATYDATVIKKLKDAGVVFLGRTNMDEFAMGGSNENSAFGPVKNPHDTSRVPGGSSGGSAAAVAMDATLAALGTDTGGSIREPASFCGVVGLKPTYGAVSRFGVMAMTSSLDQVGPLAKTVEDAEIIFNTIKGRDPMDSTSFEMNETRPEKKVIGVPFDILKEGIDKDVLENFNASLEVYKKQGYTIKDIDLPMMKYSLAVYYVIVPAEVSSNTARYDGVKYGLHVDGKDLPDDYLSTRAQGFGPEVRRRIMLGTYVLSQGYYDAYYSKALKVKKLITADFNKAFQEVDAIMMPVSPTPAFKIGEKTADPISMYLADIFTVPANLAGIPAISVPSGTVNRDGKALPVGLQIIAPAFAEQVLFDLGKKFEQSRL
ncbi:Asp-tRNA(Asn)/Glu-tRNA(Gln) amidotransferase subunit GatA [Candidatus Parcubacteria bacterium]|nr:Asp-tRNA(Asn)/Glu-tRNA(Gln) amidotransferase subunit GatA [Candidatus Parcubacteria bacterium]